MVLPKERAVEIANRAMDVLEKENRMRGEIARAGRSPRSPTCRSGRRRARDRRPARLLTQAT